jgi:hypothetical protein
VPRNDGQSYNHLNHINHSSDIRKKSAVIFFNLRHLRAYCLNQDLQDKQGCKIMIRKQDISLSPICAFGLHKIIYIRPLPAPAYDNEIIDKITLALMISLFDDFVFFKLTTLGHGLRL